MIFVDRPEHPDRPDNSEFGLTKQGKKAIRIFLIVLLAFCIIVFSWLAIIVHNDHKGVITQEIWQDYLYTSLKYNGETLFVDYDEIKLNTNMDSIKCVRYNYCIQLLEKTKQLDNFKCE